MRAVAPSGESRERTVIPRHSGVSAGHTSRLGPQGIDEPWPLRRLLVLALCVAVAYFLGARLGLFLRLPGHTPSVLWPPNALLTSALLLVPPRHWSLCLFAALPAHLSLNLDTEWPSAFVAVTSNETACRRPRAKLSSPLQASPAQS